MEDIFEAVRRLGELEARVDVLYSLIKNDVFMTTEDVCLVMGFDELYTKIKAHKEELLKGCASDV